MPTPPEKLHDGASWPMTANKLFGLGAMRYLLLILLADLAGAADLARDLTFRAGFEGSTDAQVARGDKHVYAAPSYKEQASAQPGLAGTDVELAAGQGL